MKLTYIVPSDMDGTLLHDVLRKGMGLSAQLCKTVKHTPGALLVDGAAMFANQRVRQGMRVQVDLPREENAPPQKDATVDVVFEDDALLCVYKPEGIVCHPTRGLAAGEETLLERVSAYLGYAPHPVHRLDRGTSGLWLLAKNSYVQNALIVERKTYEALCVGRPPREEGDICAPVLSISGSARRVISPEGKDARTLYRLVRAAGGVSLLELTLCTGRTHQIRVHMASIGCPVVGDALYGGEESMACARALGVSRMCLHASGLVFVHPLTGERMDVRRPCQTFPTLMME